ncbi:M23 family metallopeptidase [Uliginosibacterium sp. H1]|uniref:M23 family metallopeptidase n=1 Tax=Uliginosibacterium sp. H1 TaxID=3114757 RepID=UPI002E18DC3C|nr:M23 family metallopeptidase [Uliginosibacterium sp. H1]
MAFALLSSRSIAQAGVRLWSVRRITLMILASSVLAAAVAFVAGVTLGKYFSDSALVQAASLNARDTAEGRYAVERMGELAGKLVRLEQEASVLGRKIDALELFGQKAAGSRAAVSVLPATLNQGANTGGPALAPRLCDDQAAGQPTLSADMQRMALHMDCLMDAFSLIQQAAATRSVAYMKFPSRAPIPEVELGSPFGNRSDPFTGSLAFHSGLDFSAAPGTPIRAAGGGRVVFAGFRSDMGNMVELEHGSGLVTRYAHASRLNVRAGDVVTPGQVVAFVGSTGRSTGPHLHFEVLHEGSFVDPRHYLSLGEGMRNG